MRMRLSAAMMSLLFCGSVMAQHVQDDRTEQGVRRVSMSGRDIDINLRSHVVSFTGYLNVPEADVYYSIDVYTHWEISEESRLVFLLFNGEEITLDPVFKDEGDVVWPLRGIGKSFFLIPIPAYLMKYEITKEQLDSIFASGIRKMTISAGENTRGHTWKKDKLGAYMKRSFDKFVSYMEQSWHSLDAKAGHS